jgi:hypothetical protein
MSTADDEARRRLYKEFLDLLPVTTVISGLAPHAGPRSLTTDQMEARAQVLASAFKLARQMVRDVLRNG